MPPAVDWRCQAMPLKICLLQRPQGTTPRHRQRPMRPAASPDFIAPVRGSSCTATRPLCADRRRLFWHGRKAAIWQEQRGTTR